MTKLLLKWIVNGAITVPLLLFYSDITFWNAAIAATGLTLVAYLIGDQLLLRATNNWIAAVCDMALAAVYLAVWAFGFDLALSWGEIFFISLLIGVAEWVLHRYVFNERYRVVG